MALPEPEPGLVINYAYLWHHEHEAGQEEGRKDRPSVIVLSVEGRHGATVVTVLPITHVGPRLAPGWPQVGPRLADEGVEIPAAVKRHLGLDDAPSWVLVSEGNEFEWPGHDLRKRRGGSYGYGFLPPRLFDRIVKAFVDWHQQHRGRLVSRD
jgi:hypothetical protein